MPIPYFACMLAIAAHFDLPPRILPSIQKVEGGQVGIARLNANGTEDLGLMQVNSLWIPSLAQRFGVTAEEMRTRLLQDGCFNITVAGAVVRYHLTQSNGDLLAAVGNYHSKAPTLNRDYRGKVVGAAINLFGRPEADPKLP
jgi:soluble lytic murein transglycosylase-like protein